MSRISPDAKDMAENMYRALWSFITCVRVNVMVSMFTKPRPVDELTGLVYGATPLPIEEPVPLYKNEWFWAAIAIVVFFFALNISSGKEQFMHSSGISIWFFIGVLLTAYGALILGYGLYELVHRNHGMCLTTTRRSGGVP